MTPLPFLAVLRLAGPDAVTFLQGQVTNDVRLLADGRTQLAAVNTPQGRVIALLRLREAGDSIFGLLPRDLADAAATHLCRYVLRAKVMVSVDERPLVRLEAGEAAPAGAVVFQYDPGRRVALTTGDAIAHGDDDLEGARWVAEDVAAGQPQVTAATSGQFVAQMLNLDLLDGISFQKGCYTGQEIVARTQHLGRIKRRTLRYRSPGDGLPAPMSGVLAGDQKVGDVLTSARIDGAVELLAVVSLEAADQPLRLADGRTIERLPLPGIAPA
ncbi:MAG: hypothetical protein U1F08_06750 [Steroidobacteraceae bacterium]